MLWNCCVEERSKFLEILYGEKGTFSFIYGANSWLKWVNAEWDTFFFWTVVETFCIRQSLQKHLLIENNTSGNKADDAAGSELV